MRITSLPEVRLKSSVWEYRELRIPTSGGEAPNAIEALSAAGRQGWETSGVSMQTPGATIIILKRQR